MLIFNLETFPLESFIMSKKYELDPYQRKLLECDSNALVIAGAGTGKTFTILGKINYLIENNICLPERILVISFTNASVEDIKKKMTYNVDVLTFHKLAMTILEKNNLQFSLCSNNLLSYIIDEYLKTCSLKEQKYILKFLKLTINYKKFLNSKFYNSFKNLIETFINLYKTNNLNMKDVINKKYTKTEKNILSIIFNIYKIYLEEKQSMQQLDFDDIIIKATELVKYTFLNYKYIIIDEFQDTSYIRLNLIKEIYNYNNCQIIVVGDDYQSIYHFSGCDLNIFLNFNKFFPNVKRIDLKNTYRNSYELINIASTFITKNPLQIKKELISNKRCNNPLILVPYTNKKEILKKVLNSMLKDSKDIMILVRNNNDIYDYIDNNFTLDKNTIYYKKYILKYYTVHKSKGLEADNVIILNCNNEFLGFPNKIENNILINKLLPNDEIKYAEERRLFYVAITRCREKTFLVYDKNNPSIFIKEIKRIVKRYL